MAGITSRPLPRVITPYQRTASPPAIRTVHRQPTERLAEPGEVVDLQRQIKALRDRLRFMRDSRDKWKRKAIACGGYLRSKGGVT